MADRKDYYSILGITEDEKKLDEKEFNKVLKTKYRKLAKEWHPDRYKEDAEKKKAEEKFKEIAEAYAVLSDAKKKQEYDNPASNFNFEGFGNGGMDINDILRGFGMDMGGFGGFGGFGNFGGRTATKQIKKGQSIRLTVPLTLKEMYDGVTKNIKYSREEPCKHCGGKGTINGRVIDCPKCGGTGTIIKTVNSPFGIAQTMTECPDCHGSGKSVSNPCTHCHGRGIETVEHTTEINIPKGVADGIQIKYQGEGSASIRNEGINGDLYLQIVERDNSQFTRQGNDLYITIDINPIDAILGCTKEIETISGKKLTTKIPSGTEQDYRLRFVGYGMPIYGTNSFGNMYGIVKIKMPKTLTSEERHLLEELKTKPHFK